MTVRRRILHISGDYPDPIDPAKTPVIASLIDLVDDEFDHEVISTNRRTPTLRAHKIVSRQTPFERGAAIEYRAFPYGLLHKASLIRLGDWIADLVERGRRPDAIMAHKLTIEAIAARRVADRLGIPFGVLIQGNTDTKILDMRPDLRSAAKAIFDDARTVFSLTPWAIDRVTQVLGVRDEGVRLLPCPTDLDAPSIPKRNGDRLISVFHLRNWKIKNLAGIAKAMQLLEAEDVEKSLSVIGGGTAIERQQCEAVCRTRSISFAGSRDRAGVRDVMSRSIALVMPSHRESFGLVFIEALFAGLPIIYPKGTAVDGYLDGLPFALAVDADRPAEIARAIRKVCDREVELKETLQEWHRSGASDMFRRPAIAETFAQGLRELVGDKPVEA